MKEYFVGIPLPEKCEAEFADLLRDIKRIDPDLETVDPKTPHITVYYLDTQPQKVLPEIAKVIKDHAPRLQGVNLIVNSLGFFGLGDPRVVFLDVKYPLILSDFNEIMAHNLASFYTEDNNLEFHPHLTVARMRTEEAQNSFAKKKPLLEERLSQIAWNFPVTELVLYGVDPTKKPKSQEKLIKIPILR